MKKLANATVFISIALALFPVNVKAQLIPDNTLGNENTRVINGNNRQRISGGAIRGANLFHSFREFNVNLGQEVYFVNPTVVENILTRVTGANPSNIFGTLGVEGNANLFLLNPNGILFGNGARLDLNGAFVGSTASEIQLGSTGNFSATNPSNSNLLNIKPSALFFNALAAHQNQITVEGTLRVEREKTIGLYGGNILIDGGTISAPRGQIFLGAVNSGRVNLDINNNRIDYSGVNSFGDIEVIRNAEIRANTGGSVDGKGIDIAANRLILNGGSEISANTVGSGKGGEINIRSNSVSISGNGTEIRANVGRRNGNNNDRSSGNGGRININTNSLNLLENAEIRADTFGAGNGGEINITANTVRINESGEIQANVRSGATGNGGTININTNSLKVLKEAEIKTQTSAIAPPGQGNAGNIFIKANSIEIGNGSSDIEADVTEGATGNGGTININTNSLKVFDGGNIRVDTDGVGAGGKIDIVARDLVEVIGAVRLPNGDITTSDIEADVGEQASGNGGTININTNTLRVLNGGEIQATTDGVGSGGTINIVASNLVEVSDAARLPNGDLLRTTRDNIINSQIEVDADSNFPGIGGTININTGTLRVLNGGEIKANNFGSKNGGEINISAQIVEVRDFLTSLDANGEIEIDPSQIQADVRPGATGNGGTININSNTLRVLNGGEIKTQTFGTGNGGNINITATDLVEVSGFTRVGDREVESQIEADVGRNATGDGGTIAINTNTLKVLNGAEIRAETEAVANPGQGNAGDIIIEAKQIEVGSGADIEADVIRRELDNGEIIEATGNGGNIIINTDSLRIFDRGDIETQTFAKGDAGNINITANSIEVTNPGSTITTNTREFATGSGGTIDIRSNRLSITDRGAIEANILGAGQAADNSITINSNFVNLDNGTISALTETARAGGNINLNLDTLLSLRNGSRIDTESRSQQLAAGRGGNISINSPYIVAFRSDNEIVTRAIAGDGGNINISGRVIFGFPQFLTIDASSQLQIDGTVTIDTLDINPDSILRQLESSPIDAAAIVAKDLCRLEDGKIARGSSFIITGKGGLPPSPSTPVKSQEDLLDWAEIETGDRTFTKQQVKPVVVKNPQDIASEVSFIEAKGWIQMPDGKIVLTANPILGNAPNSNLVHPSCSQ